MIDFIKFFDRNHIVIELKTENVNKKEYNIDDKYKLSISSSHADIASIDGSTILFTLNLFELLFDESNLSLFINPDQQVSLLLLLSYRNNLLLFSDIQNNKNSHNHFLHIFIDNRNISEEIKIRFFTELASKVNMKHYLNFTNIGLFTPLHFAIQYSYSRLSLLLIDLGSDVNIIDTFNKSILDYAFDRDLFDVVKKLIELNVKMDGINYLGQTLLQKSILKKASDLIIILLNKGFDPLIKDRTGTTSLHYLVQYQLYDIFVNVFTELIKKGFNVNITTDNLDTLLHYSLRYYNNINIIKLLLDNAANVNAVNRSGETPLHIIVKNKIFNEEPHLEVVRLLLSKNPNLDLNIRAFILKNNLSNINSLMSKHRLESRLESRLEPRLEQVGGYYKKYIKYKNKYLELKNI